MLTVLFANSDDGDDNDDDNNNNNNSNSNNIWFTHSSFLKLVNK